MKTCPRCGSVECTKDGIIADRQRFKCKSCQYRYTVDHRGFGLGIKRQALVLYLQGLDFRSIGRILHCSHVTVHNWIKFYGKEIEGLRSETGVEWVNIDQLNELIAAKKKESDTTLLLIDIDSNDSASLCVAELEIEPKKNILDKKND